MAGELPPRPRPEGGRAPGGAVHTQRVLKAASGRRGGALCAPNRRRASAGGGSGRAGVRAGRGFISAQTAPAAPAAPAAPVAGTFILSCAPRSTLGRRGAVPEETSQGQSTRNPESGQRGSKSWEREAQPGSRGARGNFEGGGSRALRVAAPGRTGLPDSASHNPSRPLRDRKGSSL